MLVQAIAVQGSCAIGFSHIFQKCCIYSRSPIGAEKKREVQTFYENVTLLWSTCVFDDSLKESPVNQKLLDRFQGLISSKASYLRESKLEDLLFSWPMASYPNPLLKLVLKE
jgi:hypothetical protein